MKVADLACEELGMTNEEDDRFAYADDIAEDKGGGGEEKATASLQELEAAAALTGLIVNPAKSEAIGCRIKKNTVVSEDALNAVKELVQVEVKKGTKEKGMDGASQMEGRAWCRTME